MQLTKEQIQIAEFPSMGNFAVKGIAGSGKTSIGIHRIAYLLENKCPDEDDKILVLTFNKSLIKYIEFLYEKFASSFPRQLSLTDLNQKNPHDKVVINTLSDISYKCFEAYFAEQQKPKVIWNTNRDREIKQSVFTHALEKTKREIPDAAILSQENADFLEKEINWLKACMYFDEKEYLQADRTKIGRKEKELKILPKNSPERMALFKLYENFRSLMNRDNCLEFIDTEIVAVNYARRNEITKYTHIIIDESQDLSKLQFEFIKNLAANKEHSSITFLYDTSQSIYPNSWLGMGKSFSSAGFDVTGRTRIIRNNYRTSNEILSAARNMIYADEALNDGEPFYCNQSGIRPLYVECGDQDQQNHEIVKLLSDLKEKFDLKDIAVTSRYNRNLYALKELLDKHNIESEIVNRRTEDYGKESVKLITFHSFKGIESQVVIIPDLVKGQFPFIPDNGDIVKSGLTEERKLLYVAMTRASKMLFLFSYDQKSDFLNDIPPELFRNIKLAHEELLDEVREPHAEYERSFDYQSVVKEIESSYEKFVDQKERLEKKDKEEHPELKLLSRLAEFVKENNLLEADSEIEADEKLIDEVVSEIIRKKEENRQLNLRLNKLISDNKELLTEKKDVIDYNSLFTSFKEDYPELPDSMIECLSTSEYFLKALPNKNTDYSVMYTSLAKVIENLLRTGIDQYGIDVGHKEKTLGPLFYKYYNEDHEWKLVLSPLDHINFIRLRNRATHSGRIKIEELNNLRKILYERRLLRRMIEMVY